MDINLGKRMIEKIEFWLNIIHYSLYRVDYRIHILSNKLNPFVLLGRIPAIKRKFKEQGTTLLDTTNKIWTDKRYGFGIMISGAGLAIIVFFIIWAVFLLLNSKLPDPIDFSWLPFGLCMGLAYAVCHFTVFRQDKYIGYFRKFEKWSKKERWSYSLLSLAFIVAVIALFIYSFRFIPKI